VFSLSLEMAAHRFTKLATPHLDLRVHFLRTDEEGVIWKAYENDGVPLPADNSGAIEGQRACRHWGARRAFYNDETFDAHCQFTETDQGNYWSTTTIVSDTNPRHAITVGVPERAARWFRGHQTTDRQRSHCPVGPCCRTPTANLADRWAGHAWPSSAQHSHVLATFPVGAFPGVDLTDVYEFLDRQSAG
jgi:predicted transcriptional regulator